MPKADHSGAFCSIRCPDFRRVLRKWAGPSSFMSAVMGNGLIPAWMAMPGTRVPTHKGLLLLAKSERELVPTCTELRPACTKFGLWCRRGKFELWSNLPGGW